MHRSPPTPGYYTTWYPAKIKTLLQEPKAYLLENKEGKVFRRTEQHIRLHNETSLGRRHPLENRPPHHGMQREQRHVNNEAFSASSQHKVPTYTYEAPAGNNTKKRRSDYDIVAPVDDSPQTSNQHWRERNLRPTPSLPAARARRSKNLRLSLSPPSSPQQSPDSEPRRSRRIQARRSNSDTE